MSNFENAFYIMETSPNWYQARMTKTHFCFSCGSSLQDRLDGITRVVAKYKDENDFMFTHLSDDASGSNHMSVATKEQHIAQYSERGHLYDDDILFAVQKGLAMRPKKEDKIKKAMSKIKIKPKTPSFAEVERRVLVEETKKTPLHLPKKKTGKVEEKAPKYKPTIEVKVKKEENAVPCKKGLVVKMKIKKHTR